VNETWVFLTAERFSPYGRKANSGRLAVLVSHGHCVPKLDDTRGFRDFESGIVGSGARICMTSGRRVSWKPLFGAVCSISHGTRGL